MGQIIFAVVLVGAIALFVYHVRLLRRTILLGRPYHLSDKPSKHWRQMIEVALLQKKMMDKPVASAAHWVIYVGFLVVNVEVIEIILDGLLGTHRLLAGHVGVLYDIMTVGSEIFLALVLVAAVVFLWRRNIQKVPRFHTAEMKGWPPLDANIILWTEIALVIALLIMNASDQALQQRKVYEAAGTFPVSRFLVPLFESLSDSMLIGIERTAWWVHILGVLAFLNYIPFSKHLHIFLAFPNTYYAPIQPAGKVDSLPQVTSVVKEALGLAPAEGATDGATGTLGAKDVTDLTWKNLLDAYTCTECGRCTAVCPAHLTGKKLSPRKIMMDTRDRLEEIKRALHKTGKWEPDGKSLLGDYITAEEIWACTTCNACVRACPVLINPVSIILQLRQYLVMEASQAPETINVLFVNLENNGSPWALPAADRAKWAETLT
ncbi:MAG: (Fe-S)-binding protein [Bacteroidia bacterium]|nr:(Fe-S)-binding protein [Bacteroidia bacterium]MCX7764372.1 (Fe-S)-binding protein [Bacteroidia bacterium]MDW8057932.1 (Fe-S)-binding protein [Bacteroidia bacterium]